MRRDGEDLLFCWSDNSDSNLLDCEESSLGFLRLNCQPFNKDSPRCIGPHHVENVTYRRDAWRLPAASLTKALQFLSDNRVSVVYLEHCRRSSPYDSYVCVQGYSDQSQRRCAYRREKNFFRFRLPMTCLSSSPGSPSRFSVFQLLDILKASGESELVLVCRSASCTGAFTLSNFQGLRGHVLFEIPTLPESCASEQLD
jgi:hypothetical protein